MKSLRVVRNTAALFILAMSLLATRPLVATSQKDTCIQDSSTVGYNCVFNSNGTCSSSKCQAGQACGNSKCVDFDYCQKNCCFFCK